MRLRPSAAIGVLLMAAVRPGAFLGAMAYLVVLVSGRAVRDGLLLGLVAGVCAVLWEVPRVRRWSLTVSDAGLVERRTVYRVGCSWEDVVGVRCRRRWRGGLFRTETLLLRRSSVEAVDGQGERRKAVLARVADRAEDLQLNLNAFDAGWRDGPIGEALIARGLSLGCSCPRHGSAGTRAAGRPDRSESARPV